MRLVVLSPSVATRTAMVGGVGEEALFAGVDGVKEAFAGEVAVFDEGEAAAVEGEAGGIGDPESAEGLGDAAVAVGDDGDALGIDFGLQDRERGGLVLADGDGAGELVLEEVVEGCSGGVGDEGSGGGFLVGDLGCGTDIDGLICGSDAAHDAACHPGTRPIAKSTSAQNLQRCNVAAIEGERSNLVRCCNG